MMQAQPIRSADEDSAGDRATDSPAQRGHRGPAEPGGTRSAARVTFGEELRRERELRQVGLREIAEATKINRRYLEALERNDFSDLPGGLFNRSFVRAYCQTIGIDDEAMVNAYLLEEQIQEANRDRFDPDVWRGDPASRTVAGRQRRGPRRRRAARGSWLWIVAAIAIVLAALAWFYLRTRPQPGDRPAEDSARDRAAWSAASLGSSSPGPRPVEFVFAPPLGASESCR